MLFEDIPCVIFHLLAAFFTQKEFVAISKVCKLFNKLLKSGKHFKYIKCGNCSSKKDANDFGHLACFAQFDITEFHCDDKILKRYLGNMQIHIFKWLLYESRYYFNEEHSKINFLFKAKNIFAKHRNEECFKFVLGRIEFHYKII